MVLLCDGRLVCGCADPYGRRVLGDTKTASVSAVWTGETASSLRRELNAGGSKFCNDAKRTHVRITARVALHSAANDAQTIS